MGRLGVFECCEPNLTSTMSFDNRIVIDTVSYNNSKGYESIKFLPLNEDEEGKFRSCRGDSKGFWGRAVFLRENVGVDRVKEHVAGISNVSNTFASLSI